MIPSAVQPRADAFRRYVHRLERRIVRLNAISRRYAMIRLGIAVTGVLATVLMNYLAGGASPWIAAGVFILAFLVVAHFHERVEHGLRRHRCWLRIKATHLARATLDWPRIPLHDPAPSDAGHPFDVDLNMTGARSLHHLLDTAASRGGSDRLREWLLHPAVDPAQVRDRQALLRELIPLSGFRDRLTLHGLHTSEDMDARWNGEAVCRWLAGRTGASSLRPFVVLTGTLSAMNVFLYTLSALLVIPPWWMGVFAAYALLYTGLYVTRRDAVGDLYAEASRLENVLAPFRSILVYLESYPLTATPRLAGLCAPFREADKRPSKQLKRLARIAGAAKWQKGQLLWLVINAVVPWDLYFTYRLHRFRERMKTVLPVWLETWYDLEAYAALAHFGYLHPGAVFPEVAAPGAGDRPVLETRGLGHPLLPDAERVCNDFTIDRVGDIAVITGSNMSGKSTFLRTLGVNMRLAYAGAPVLASTFRVIPFRVFTCIKVSDSVTEGISYFYAEVRRLKALLEALGEAPAPPLFFLIDEIFRGTNNRERLTGSRAYIRVLAEGHGAGVISTHDLELVHLEEEIPRLRNYHFREDVQHGVMVFDYRLRPGPCPTTNALKIMRLEGLPL